MIGFAAIAVDVGAIHYDSRRLQGATDLAARGRRQQHGQSYRSRALYLPRQWRLDTQRHDGRDRSLRARSVETPRPTFRRQRPAHQCRQGSGNVAVARLFRPHLSRPGKCRSRGIRRRHSSGGGRLLHRIAAPVARRRCHQCDTEQNAGQSDQPAGHGLPLIGGRRHRSPEISRRTGRRSRYRGRYLSAGARCGCHSRQRPDRHGRYRAPRKQARRCQCARKTWPAPSQAQRRSN